ncbi:MAG: pitrilysin family protein [Pseudomonadota bacterium]|nr:pitrilysin family protein [Pseudomonadota bacterium]
MMRISFLSPLVACMAFLILLSACATCATCAIWPNTSQKENPAETAAQKSSQSQQTQIFHTQAGIPVWLAERQNLPMVDIQLTFDAGALNDGQQPGMANLVGNLIGEATDSQNAQDISTVFENQGARFGVSVRKTRASISLRTLTGEPLAVAVNQLALLLSNSQFKVEDVDRAKAQLATYFRYIQTDPSYQAQRAVDQQLYGAHDLAQAIIGEQDVVMGLSAEDLQAFWSSYYHQGNVVMTMTGALNPAEAKQVAEQLSKALAKAPINWQKPEHAKLTSTKKGQAQWLDFDAKQAQLSLSAIIPVTRLDKDYAALQVASMALGGDSASRLYQQIREVEGLSYSVGSQISAVHDAALFEISLQTQANQAEQALKSVQGELDAWYQQGITEDELARAKAKLRLSMAQLMTQNGATNSYLSLMAYEHLPVDYLQRFLSHIESLELKEVDQAIQRHIKPSAMLITVLGADRG